MNKTPAWQDQARTLANLLGNTADLWRPAPFYDDPPWVSELPVVAQALLELNDADAETLERNPDALQRFLSGLVPPIGVLSAAAAVCLDAASLPESAPAPTWPPLSVPETHGRDVPGRKWQQLLHFAGTVGTPCGPLVEWCSGKAHLGRLLARTHGVAVTAIERNAALCAEGKRLAQRDRLHVQMLHADVLQLSASAACCHADTHAIALHACGDLHLALLRAGGDAGIAAFDLAPCCYHLTRDPFWQPLSKTLTNTPLATLNLQREELRLAVQESVTASARVLRQSRTLSAWRLGFDALQRRLRDIDTALHTPARPLGVLAAGYAALCADFAAHHQIVLPGGLDYPALEQAGHARLHRVRRLELLRHACRRPLEIALVTDRALYLAEHGYAVTVRTFCPRPLTPRNLMISARRITPASHTPRGT